MWYPMPKNNKLYEDLEPNFFDASLKSTNMIRNYYHYNRYEKIRKIIYKHPKAGVRVLDIGSGSSSWNTDGVDVTAIDCNRKMLSYGKQKGYIKNAIVWDIEKTPYPIRKEKFDFVVISEVLEHLKEPNTVIKEAIRHLRSGAPIVITVPNDVPLSLWNVLFNAECFIKGDLLGNNYYKKRCGHIWHFSYNDLEELLASASLTIIEKKLTPMNICVLAKKR